MIDRSVPKFVFYVTRRLDDRDQSMVWILDTVAEARKFLDVLLGDDGIVWENPCTIRSSTGIVVSTRWYADLMRAAVDHEYTQAERSLQISYTARNVAASFRNGVRAISSGGVARPDETPRAPRPAPTPRAPRDGLVSVAEVADQLGVEPRIARAALRRMKLEKPSAGWAWPAAEIPSIVERVRAAL